MKIVSYFAMATLALSAGTAIAQSIDWPHATQEAKPGTRWWWLGSAVDSTNLTRNLEAYAKAGIGAVEITPIYGVIGNEANDIEYLSPRWMNMLGHTEAEGKRLGIQVDMNNGTGWPFGGPEVSLEESATRAIFHVWKSGHFQPQLSDKEIKQGATLVNIWSYPIKGTEVYGKKRRDGSYTYARDLKYSKQFPDIVEQDTTFVALYVAHTLQAVKRAAPGGEGYVMDHLNPKAVSHYFERFDKAFASSGVAIPNTFFNDSYEVYDADWTPAMLDEFAQRRGYRLEDHFPAFLDDADPDHKRVVSDYRETMSDLLLEVFTHTWADWAHSHGAKVRNQAHGSPAVLLDVYASVDIPEIEGYGLSDFGIKGLRTDSLWKKNDSDLSMLKYASSAAHIMGKRFTSSETFTWLTEHFRTSLSQCKPDFDLMMVGGVNHAYFHGTTYSPAEARWPGHLFYASMEMSPINTIWRDAPVFFQYITRTQSFMQWGRPDNDLLMYMPIYDIWYQNPGRLLMLAIHGMEKKSPKFVDAVMQVYGAGYDMDYISDRMILNTKCVDGRLVTEGGASYSALVLPEVQIMQPETMQHIVSLAQAGATIIIVGGAPADVPGLKDMEQRTQALAQAVAQLPANVIRADSYAEAMSMAKEIKPEPMKSIFGLKSIRRSNQTGHHYFISDLQRNDVDAFVPLAVHAESAIIFDPLTGRKGLAEVRVRHGKSEVHLQLRSGESCILQTYDQHTADQLRQQDPSLAPWHYYQLDEKHAIDLTLGSWEMLVTEKSMRGISLGAASIKRSLAPNSRKVAKPKVTVDKTSRKSDIAATRVKTNFLAPFTALNVLSHAMGTGSYTTTIKLNAEQLALGTNGWILDLGDVRESARVYINDVFVSTLVSVPYQVEVGKYLKPGKNEFRIEVTGLAANYVSWLDREGVQWRKFKNANIAPLPGTTKVSDFSKWGLIPMGLNSSVKLIPLK